MHLVNRIRVDDLVTQRTKGQVGALGNVRELFVGRLVHTAAVYRPQATQNTEHAAFTATVGTDDQQIVAAFDPETQLFHQDISIWTYNRYIFENDFLRTFDHLATLREDLVLLLYGLLTHRGDQALLGLARVELVHHLH